MRLHSVCDGWHGAEEDDEDLLVDEVYLSQDLLPLLVQGVASLELLEDQL